MKKRFTEEQITYALRRHESGMPAKEIVRETGVSEASFYNWERKYSRDGPYGAKETEGT